MENDEKITTQVILCTFNGSEYIKSQLESILSQTRKPDSLFIRDDCSTDNTISDASDFLLSKGFSDFQIEKNKRNLGWKNNFIDSFNKSSAKYVFLSDQDDVWEKTKIEKMACALDENPEISVLCCNFSTGGSPVFSQKGQLLNKISPRKRRNYTIRFPGCVMAIRKESIGLINANNVPHDLYFWLAALLTNSLFWLSDDLVFHRVYDSSASSRHGKPLYEKKVEDCEDILCCLDAIRAHETLSSRLDYALLDKYRKFVQSRLENIKNHSLAKGIPLFLFKNGYFFSFKSSVRECFFDLK